MNNKEYYRLGRSRRSFIHIIVSLLCWITAMAFIFTMWKATKYLDFAAGIAVCALGYDDQRIQ